MAYSFFVLDRAAWNDPHQALSANLSAGNAAPGHQLTLVGYTGASVSIGATRIQDAGTPSSGAVTLNGEFFAAGTDVELDYGFVVQDAGGIQYFVGRIDMHGGSGDYDGSVITAGWDPVGHVWVGPPLAGAVLTVVNVPNAQPWEGASGSTAVATSSLDPYSNDARLGSGIAAQAVGSPGLGVPCLAAGTLIETADGPRAIETLAPGDLIQTRDHGLQPLVWVGQIRVPAVGRLAPVCFDPGSVGNRRLLRVSQAHRILIQGWQPQILAGEEEVLVPARALVNGRTIRIVEAAEVTYLHLLLPNHEIILAEGCATESLHAADLSVFRFAPRLLADVQMLLRQGRARSGPMARPGLQGGISRLLVA